MMIFLCQCRKLSYDLRLFVICDFSSQPGTFHHKAANSDLYSALMAVEQ